MSKPLELAVHQPLERPRRGEDITAYRSQFIDEILLIQAKRFTDSELAAEVWAALHAYDMYEPSIADPVNARLKEMAAVTERFATHPHYDEES